MASDLNAIDSDNSEKLFSATELNTSAKPPKTKAEYQKEYRERQKAKKYENKQESSAKPPKTKAEYQKEYRERQKAKKYENKQESSAKPPKTNAEYQKEFRERQKAKKNENKQESSAKPPKTNAEYQKEFRERQKAKKNENKQESTAKPPKTNAEHQMAFRERQKLKKIINKRESIKNAGKTGKMVCEVCNKTFSEYFRLKYHIRSVHFNLQTNILLRDGKKINQIWFEGVLNTDNIVEIKKTGNNVLLLQKYNGEKSVKLLRNEHFIDLRDIYPTYTSKQQMQCEICLKWMLKRDLKLHYEEKHTKVKKHECSNCHATFKRSYFFIRHVCHKTALRRKRTNLQIQK